MGFRARGRPACRNGAPFRCFWHKQAETAQLGGLRERGGQPVFFSKFGQPNPGIGVFIPQPGFFASNSPAQVETNKLEKEMNKVFAALVAGLFATSVFAQAPAPAPAPMAPATKADAKADAASDKAAKASAVADAKAAKAKDAADAKAAKTKAKADAKAQKAADKASVSDAKNAPPAPK
jgi:hypothetical protein